MFHVLKIQPLNMADRRPCYSKYFMCFFHVSGFLAIQSLAHVIARVLHLDSVPLSPHSENIDLYIVIRKTALLIALIPC
jgi:hypothetical protein